jgi:glutamate dehydrogenase (NAD(P)+)
MQEMTGKPAPPNIREELSHGSDELDLVRSGLDDTMRNAYLNIREIFLSRDNVPDLRTASFVLAIEKITSAYKEMGL